MCDSQLRCCVSFVCAYICETSGVSDIGRIDVNERIKRTFGILNRYHPIGKFSRRQTGDFFFLFFINKLHLHEMSNHILGGRGRDGGG